MAAKKPTTRPKQASPKDVAGRPLGTKVTRDTAAGHSIAGSVPPPVKDLDSDTLDNAQDCSSTLWNADQRGNLGRSSPETQSYGHHPYLPDPPGAKSMGINTGKQHEVGDDANKQPFGRNKSA